MPILSVVGNQSALAMPKPGHEAESSLQGTRAQSPAMIIVAETKPKEGTKDKPKEGTKEKPKENEEEEEEELGEDDC